MSKKNCSTLVEPIVVTDEIDSSDEDSSDGEGDLVIVKDDMVATAELAAATGDLAAAATGNLAVAAAETSDLTAGDVAAAAAAADAATAAAVVDLDAVVEDGIISVERGRGGNPGVVGNLNIR